AGPTIPVASIVKAVMAASPRRVVSLAATLGVGVRALPGLALLMAVVAVGVGAPLASPGPEEPPKATAPQVAQPKVSAASELVTVSGRVLRPDGAPAVGARLYSYHANSEPANSDEPYSPVVRGTTDAEGRYRIDVPKADLGPSPSGDPLPIVAAADGLGIDWSPVKDPRETLTLRLVPDQPIAGRVIDS